MPRLAKIDFPRFGGDKIHKWLCMAKFFFTIDNTLEESKVPIATIHFDGLARTWHQALVQKDNGVMIPRDSRNYRTLLKERFEEVLDDPIA